MSLIINRYRQLHQQFPDTAVDRYRGEPDEDWAARCFHRAWVELCKAASYDHHSGPAICYRAAGYLKSEQYRVNGKGEPNEHLAIIEACGLALRSKPCVRCQRSA